MVQTSLFKVAIFAQLLGRCWCYFPSIQNYSHRRATARALKLGRYSLPICAQLGSNKARELVSTSTCLRIRVSTLDDINRGQNISHVNEDDVLQSSDGANTNNQSTANGKAGTSTLSPAAQWHQKRHHAMLQKYRLQILPLERDSCSNLLALSLLALANTSLLSLSLLSGQLSIPKVILLAIFPGSMFSLWTLQILHDCLHGSLFPKQSTFDIPLIGRVRRKTLQNKLLFWGSMPSAFGYYLYLKYGHLTHHKSLGDPESVSLKTLFDSHRNEFEDGDVLFVAHRMKLKGEVGPRFQIGKKEIVMSISKSGFSLWKEGAPIRNAVAFACSFLYERLLLVVNDVVVAITGRNYFFPNKPQQFHDECAAYCRCAVTVRILLWKMAGWKALLFLYLSETLWSIPPHPACAMFVTNHGSNVSETGECIPSSSTYAGKCYSIFTLGTNYHMEHHDFPTIPLHRLGRLREIAPEYYREGSNDSLLSIMKKAFSKPEFYACMDAGLEG